MKKRFLQIRVSESDKKALEILAEQKGISMSDYVRMKIKDDFSAFASAQAGITQIDPSFFQKRA